MLRLRVRSSTGVQTLTVDSSSTFHQLKTQLNASALLAGYPPKPIDASDHLPLSAFLSNGDSLVVKSSPAAESTSPVSKREPPVSSRPMVIRVVPDDNSCLFRSVNNLLSRPNSQSNVYQLRQEVSTVVSSYPQLYTEAYLGRPNAEYCAWILSDNAWGGAIELSILAQRFAIQIAAFDLKTMRLDRYGEGNGYSKVGYLIYDGIHYNYMASPLGDVDVTLMDVNDELSLINAQKVAQTEHDAKNFTDTASFKLVCGDCGALLNGEAEAVAHATTSGHTNFREK